jgi:hypothetical protein
LVEDNINGLKFAAGDLNGLQNCLEHLAKSPSMARKWGAASRQKAYSIVPSVGAQKWVRVFDELSAG